MKAKRVDGNQPEIIEQAKKLGISVQSLHEIGKGCPDILFGYAGINILAEIKDGKNDLNDLQIIYHNNWSGQVCTIRNIDDLVIEFLSYSNAFYSMMSLIELWGKYQEMVRDDTRTMG